MSCSTYTGTDMDLTVVDPGTGAGGQALTTNFKNIADNIHKVMASSTDITPGYLDAKVSAGLEVSADVMNVVLHTTTPGLEIDGVSNGLKVLVDGSLMEFDISGNIIVGSGAGGDGIAVTTGSIAVDLAANSGLKFATAKLSVSIDNSLMEFDGTGQLIVGSGAGGDGIAVTTGSIAVDLAANSGLTFATAKLAVKLDSSLMEFDGTGNIIVGSGAGGDGIAVTTGSIAVDLAVSPGLTVTGGKLHVTKVSDPTNLGTVSGAAETGSSTFPTVAEVQAVYDKVNTLMANMRTANHI